ncbi:uncharacterized protein LOC144300865 [Canis aureus]
MKNQAIIEAADIDSHGIQLACRRKEILTDSLFKKHKARGRHVKSGQKGRSPWSSSSETNSPSGAGGQMALRVGRDAPPDLRRGQGPGSKYTCLERKKAAAAAAAAQR